MAGCRRRSPSGVAGEAGARASRSRRCPGPRTSAPSQPGPRPRVGVEGRRRRRPSRPRGLASRAPGLPTQPRRRGGRGEDGRAVGRGRRTAVPSVEPSSTTSTSCPPRGSLFRPRHTFFCPMRAASVARRDDDGRRARRPGRARVATSGGRPGVRPRPSLGQDDGGGERSPAPISATARADRTTAHPGSSTSRPGRERLVSRTGARPDRRRRHAPGADRPAAPP